MIEMLFLFSKITNCSQAYNDLAVDDLVRLYSKEDMIYLYYDGIKIGTEYVVYEHKGVEYPAYCLNREFVGITTENSYNVRVGVNVYGFVDHKIWRAIVNGYPYVDYKSLGCDSVQEAYVATKLSVYNMLYNYDMSKFVAIGPEGERIINAIKIISEKARDYSGDKWTDISFELDTRGTWQLCKDNIEYVEKIYEIQSDKEFKDCDISAYFEGETDENNFFKVEWIDNNKFKVIVPISKIDVDKRINIHVDTKVKLRLILYGNSMIAFTQNYALTGSEFSEYSTDFGDEIKKNNTNLELLKIDADSYEVLDGVEFSIYDKNNNKVYEKLKTNEDGKIIINNILPGEYYIEENEAKSGYEKINKKYQINVVFDQNNKVIIKNNKLVGSTNEEIKENEKVIQEEVLPRTGK